MSNTSTLSINLLLEQVYLEGQVHMMYENILGENTNVDPESKSMVKRVIDDMKLNADFMMTFGLGISAFVGPVSELLHNKGLNISKYDVTLLVMTAFYILLTKSKEDIDKLFSMVKEHKLESEIKPVVKFINGTISVFKVVGKKVGLTITTLMDVLSFTFMSVPVLNLLKDLAAEKGFSIDNFQQLFVGLTLSAGSYLLKNILQKKGLKESEDLEWAQDVVKPFNTKTVKLDENSLYNTLRSVFEGTRFTVHREVLPDFIIYEINDRTGGTYVDFHSEAFTIKNLRYEIIDGIKITKKSEAENIMREYIELYETLKPILFNDKPYTKESKPDKSKTKKAPKKGTS